jgi:hypothetical protein
MTAADLVRHMQYDREHFQLYVNTFVDAFRNASPDERS